MTRVICSESRSTAALKISGRKSAPQSKVNLMIGRSATGWSGSRCLGYFFIFLSLVGRGDCHYPLRCFFYARVLLSFSPFSILFYAVAELGDVLWGVRPRQFQCSFVICATIAMRSVVVFLPGGVGQLVGVVRCWRAR